MKKVLFSLLSITLMFSCLKEEDHRIDLTYEGASLRYIASPHGGIGTGNLLINGYGAIRDIEIFNRASMDELPPEMTFFSLYTKDSEGNTVTRVLEREFLSEFPNPFGKPRQQLGGLPRFTNAIFHNAYPVVRLNLIDEAVPLNAEMTTWSPMIPVDPTNSSIPSASIEWKLTNPTNSQVAYSIAFAMGNPMRSIDQNGSKSHLGCTITPYKTNGWEGFTFSSPLKDSLKPDAGAFRVIFPEVGKLSTPLYTGGWWDDAHIYWDDFSSDGSLEVRMDTAVQENNKAGVASMFISGTLEPGESITVPFIFSWYVPYRTLESNMAFDNDQIRGVKAQNYYSTLFPGIDEVSEYMIDNFDWLRSKTSAFSHAMITSSVPSSVLDAAISNSASLKTNLLMQNADGDIHGYEGLGNNFGCCAGNCSHVWNYAQTMAALFPSLERNVRETGFIHSTHENGYHCFRTVFPLSDHYFKNVAADGQMGSIMRVYREWKMSGDDDWLGYLWPKVKAALEFAWKGPGELVKQYPWMNNVPVPWDPKKEGILRGDQHNTYDINFYGPNMMTGSLYLGALKACAEMALVMNEPQKSEEYQAMYKRGKKKYDELLWNGEYYTQEVEVIEGVEIPDRLKSPPDKNGVVLPKYQYGQGCLSDQLLGQYLAFISGLGYLMDTMETRTALKSIYRYNFREEMRDFENVQRIYAANDEPGLVICSWPNGDKPVLPFVYSDEVWTGIEYQVAASLIFSGSVDEGLHITKAVRSRYDGSNRNPFAEIESGRFYARAMSSWSVYQAMAGYHYDGTEEVMFFSPASDVLPHRYIWTTGEGWGTFSATRAAIKLECLGGRLELNKLALGGKAFFVFREFVPDQEVNITYENERLFVDFIEKLELTEGQSFSLDLF